MYLHRLKIHSLPGIEPGFTFEPESDKVNIVTGPNAIGKSSLVRALKYLLADVDRRNDPPDLHLEGEFLSGDVRWTVRRTGRQIAWMRDGESATPPTLPAADQFGRYRLSMESLLADDAGDRDLAAELWRTLRGGFDLEAARGHIGKLLGSTEARRLRGTVSALRQVEANYSVLRAEEAELPALERQIAVSEQAEVRVGCLRSALDLHEAIVARETCAVASKNFPARLEDLHGDELEGLKDLEGRAEDLRERRKTVETVLRTAEEDLERTGLQDAQPEPEEVAGIGKLLQRTELASGERKRASGELSQANAALRDAVAQLKGNDRPPEMDANSLERAREIVEPLVELQSRRIELQQRLELAGVPPETSEIDQLRDGVHALRAWLAAKEIGGFEVSSARTRAGNVSAWVALALAGITTMASFLAGAWWALVGGLATVAVLILLILLRFLVLAGASPTTSPLDDAKRQFTDTGLEPPPEWEARAVRKHLRENVESRLNQLRLQRERAEGIEQIRQALKKANSRIAGLAARKNELAEEIGINPMLTAAPFYRFIDISRRWDEARAVQSKKELSLEELETQISEDATRIRAFLDRWRDEDAPPLEDSATQDDLDALGIAFDALEERLRKASEAHRAIDTNKLEIGNLSDRIEELDIGIKSLFARAGLEAGARDDLARLIGQLEAWRLARGDLTDAKREENRLRDLLAGDSDLVEAVEGNAIDNLKRQLRIAENQAGEHTDLIKAEAEISTRLQEARKSHALEDAAREKDRAEEALKDKRDEALSCAATEVLLDEVESAFKTEREPDLLRRAREWFEQVTAHAFTLELRDTDRFVARDKKLGELRALNELSSGTRMQLLLALRLAWTEDRERGGESLPLFFDEALTTSDVGRFSVMARTISRLADAGRQIFYLSARHHETALWKQATGTAPAMIDLAAVRFDSALADPDALRVETPPPLPPPDRLAAEEYAVLIRVHPVNPCVDAGGVHLFHLLRDDLNLLYRLLDTWRIGTLGQLESLLASDAARTAISHRHIRRRLRQRSRTARTWTELWCQGRGKPVDRAVLDQCPAIAPAFLNRAAELAGKREGDGQALVCALRAGKLKHFRNSKTDELEKWLADKGYVDDAPTLEREERRRMTLQRVVPPSRSDTDDVNRVVDWMESAVVS